MIRLKRIIAAIFVVSVATTISSFAETEGLATGSHAPNFNARLLDDNIFRLKQMGPGIKVLSFFSVTCVPCKKELPELAALEERYPKVKFFLIHIGDEAPEQIQAFLKAVGRHPQQVAFTGVKACEVFNFKGLPHALVLDDDNKVKLVTSGYTESNMQKLEAALKAEK